MTTPDHPRNIAFRRWHDSIQSSTTVTQVLLVVAAYLSGWRVEDLLHVPPGLAQPIRSIEELSVRSLDARRADLDPSLPAGDQPYVRELATTIAFAATRARYLHATTAPVS